jgi:hypothetical protein
MSQSQQQRRYTDKIDNLLDFSFPSNNLLTCQLVKRTPTVLDANKVDLKEKFFFFLNMVTGVGQQNSRTYDWTQKIVIKFSLREIITMSFILIECAKGNYDNVLPYTKFANSGSGTTKNVSIWIPDNKQQYQNNNNFAPQMNNMGNNNNFSQNNNQNIQKNPIKINITFSESNGSKSTISISPGEAYGLGVQLKYMYDYGMDKEIETQITQPRFNNNQNYNNQSSTNEFSFNPIGNQNNSNNQYSFNGNNTGQGNNSSNLSFGEQMNNATNQFQNMFTKG